MAELLVVCSCGLDDPNWVFHAFLTPKAAKENKDNPIIFLINDV
jgi:hypothetical protein